MPVVQTKHFGEVAYAAEAEIAFTCGLPAFEGHRKFVLIQHPKTGPLVFLQSIDDANVCFPALRALAVDPLYGLNLTKEHLRLLDLPATRRPRMGEDIECLAAVSFREGGVTANLLAPFVINLHKMRGLQVVNPEPYSLQYPLNQPGKAGPCL
jgi:flagellar assembly factor FliW